MPVYIEISDVSVQAFTDMVSQPSNGQNVRRAVQRNRILKAEPLAGKNFSGNGLKIGVVRMECVRRLS